MIALVAFVIISLTLTTLVAIRTSRRVHFTKAAHINGLDLLVAKTDALKEKLRWFAHLLILIALMSVTQRGMEFLTRHRVNPINLRNMIFVVLAVKFDLHSLIDLMVRRVVLNRIRSTKLVPKRAANAPPESGKGSGSLVK
jgi:hypothetical protein